VNINRKRSRTAQLAVEGMKIKSGKVFELAGDPQYEVIQTDPDGIVPVERALPDGAKWTFPCASVSAVELEVEEA